MFSVILGLSMDTRSLGRLADRLGFSHEEDDGTTIPEPPPDPMPGLAASR
jgi:hypothetical protein